MEAFTTIRPSVEPHAEFLRSEIDLDLSGGKLGQAPSQGLPTQGADLMLRQPCAFGSALVPGGLAAALRVLNEMDSCG